MQKFITLMIVVAGALKRGITTAHASWFGPHEQELRTATQAELTETQASLSQQHSSAVLILLLTIRIIRAIFSGR